MGRGPSINIFADYPFRALYDRNLVHWWLMRRRILVFKLCKHSQIVDFTLFAQLIIKCKNCRSHFEKLRDIPDISKNTKSFFVFIWGKEIISFLFLKYMYFGRKEWRCILEILYCEEWSKIVVLINTFNSAVHVYYRVIKNTIYLHLIGIKHIHFIRPVHLLQH